MFKEIPEFQSFKGRIELVRVPYLLDYRVEEQIYEEQIQAAHTESARTSRRTSPGWRRCGRC